MSELEFDSILDIDSLNEAYLGDLDYFDKKYIDSKFSKIKDIKDPDKRSKEIAKILYNIIQNIGSTCTKAIHIKSLYEKKYKYDKIISTYCKKYLPEVNEKDRLKVKKAIDMAFLGDTRDAWVRFALEVIEEILLPAEFGFITKYFEKFNEGDSKLYHNFENVAIKMYEIYGEKYKQYLPPDIAESKAAEDAQEFFNKKIKDVNDLRPYINGLTRYIPKQIINKVFFTICPIKFRSIGEALTTYKKSYKYDKFLITQTREGAKYCFDLTYAVLEDILKAYKDL